jgi:hypothetical protein
VPWWIWLLAAWVVVAGILGPLIGHRLGRRYPDG